MSPGSGGAASPARVPRTVEVEACPICRLPLSEWFFSAEDRLLGVPGTYHYRRCLDCRTVFQSPRVVDEDLRLLYPDGYYTHSRKEALSDLPSPGRDAGDVVRVAIQAVVARGEGDAEPSLWYRVLARSRWLRERAFFDLVDDALLPWRRPPGRALDVGCGSGRLMMRLAALGWRVEGIEWDEDAARVAADATGLPVHIGDAARADRSIGRFDLIVMRHVFEHLSAPVQALASLSELLAPGGRIVLIYPNPGSLGARVFGPDWFHWDPPRHIALPPRGALSVAAARAHLRLLKAYTRAASEADSIAHSRARRREGAPYATRVSRVDRALLFASKLLVALGRGSGEEIVASFDRGLRGAGLERGPR